MADQNDGPRQPIGSELVREDASFTDIVVQFVNGLDNRLRQMEDALRGPDFEALRVAAHQLKGSGGGYGYPQLTQCAAELEKHARRQAIDECLVSIEELKALCERVVVSTDSPSQAVS